MPCAVLPMWRLFPQLRGFALVLGISVLGYGILALALIFLGCASGVAFLAPSAYPTLRLSPVVAGIVGFSCGPPLWWSLSVCGGLLGRRSCVFFSPPARRGVGYCCASSWGLPLCLFLPAPAVFRGVSCRRLPLGGYATFLAPVTRPAPAVELSLLGLRCL